MDKNIINNNIELSKANHRAAVRNCITDICKILIVSVVVMVFAIIFYLSFSTISDQHLAIRNALLITFGTILGLIEIVATIVYLRDIIIFNRAVDYKDKVLSEHAVVNKEFQNEYLTRKVDVNNFSEDETSVKDKQKR